MKSLSSLATFGLYNWYFSATNRRHSTANQQLRYEHSDRRRIITVPVDSANNDFYFQFPFPRDSQTSTLHDSELS